MPGGHPRLMPPGRRHGVHAVHIPSFPWGRYGEGALALLVFSLVWRSKAQQAAPSAEHEEDTNAANV